MEDTCNSYLWFQVETKVGNGTRACLYLLGVAYCFLGLSAITARFFRSMENIVKQTREIIYIDPYTGSIEVQRERIWNYTLADISLMAFGTSFPQISLAIIDALRNLGQRYAGGLGPGTLVGSAAFDLYPIHAVCVVVPKAGEVKKISDLGVWFVELVWSFWAYVWLYVILQVWTPNIITFWEAGLTVIQFFLLMLHAYAQDRGWKYITLPFPREDRPENWVPVESISGNGRSEYTSLTDSGSLDLEDKNWDASLQADSKKDTGCMRITLRVWLQQFKDVFTLEDYTSRKESSGMIITLKVVWKLILLPWRFIFALVPPPEIAHGWVAFVCSLSFITWISYVLTKLTDLISCVTGINPYVVAFTALASGTSWPDLVASKIAAEHQETADSAIANITCSNSANLFIGIGVPWLINTTYNMIAYREPLYVHSIGLSFSLVIFFITSVLCVAVLTLRRYFFGGELGGPRIWAWITCGYLMLLWVAFVVLSCLKVSNII